jgi:hypothetical protein
MLKLVANSESVAEEDPKGEERALYKYLILRASQPASVAQIHFKNDIRLSAK